MEWLRQLSRMVRSNDPAAILTAMLLVVADSMREAGWSDDECAAALSLALAEVDSVKMGKGGEA